MTTTILDLLEQIQIGNVRTISATLAAYLKTPYPNLDQSHAIEIPGTGQTEELTPLMLAARMGQAETITLLLKYNADINHIYFANRAIISTALMQGIKSGQIEIIKLLLNNGAEVNSEKQSPLSQNRVTCFHCALIPATELQRIDILALLLQYNANINALHNKRTAFMTSLQMWSTQPSAMQLKLTEFLLNQGAGSTSYDADEIFYNLSDLNPTLYASRRALIYSLYTNINRLLPNLEFNSEKMGKKTYKIIQKEKADHNNKITKPAKTIGFELARKTPIQSRMSKIISKYLFSTKEYCRILTYEFDRARANEKLTTYSPDENSGNKLKNLFKFLKFK